jgi:20S proteasome alpha/beta subunit
VPKQGIIDKSGAWYSYKGERIGQGRENAKTMLEQHPTPRCSALGLCARF